jgi:hypothetical protein
LAGHDFSVGLGLSFGMGLERVEINVRFRGDCVAKPGCFLPLS